MRFLRCRPSVCRDSSSGRPRVATATGSGSSRALTATLCALALVIGCVRRDENANQTGRGSAAAPSAVVATTPPAVEVRSPEGTSTPPSSIVLPPAALAALREGRPTFTLLEPRSSQDSVASAYESGDVILRADLQGLGRTDYAVAGLDRGVYRVVALFAGADGTFRAVDVTQEHTLKPIHGIPAVLLQRAECDTCMPGSTTAVIVVGFLQASSRGATRWVWNAKYSAFKLDEIVDQE